MNPVSSSHSVATCGFSDRGTALFWKAIVCVLLVESVLILTFYSLDWSWLRSLNLHLVQGSLETLGCSLQGDRYSLSLPGQTFVIDPDCTYVDLIICSFPLLWRSNRRWNRNLAVLGAFALAVFVVNLARVTLAIYAIAHGGSIFWAHDMVDYLLWYPTLGLIIFSWARNLKCLLPDVATHSNGRLTSAVLNEEAAHSFSSASGIKDTR